MKKLIFNAFRLTAFLLFTSMLFFQCTKTPDVIPDASHEEQFIEIPEEIAQYLTDDEIAAFRTAPPVQGMKPNEAFTLKNPRPKKWRPFLAFGTATGTFFPLLDNCEDPLSAVICFDEAGCPDPGTWDGLVGHAVDGAIMTGYGQVTQTSKNFICGLAGPETGWLNGTYEKGPHRLQWHPDFSAPPTIDFLDEQTVKLGFQIVVCNANAPVLDPFCWAYNTGNLADAEGVLNYRWIGPVQGLFSDPFIPIPALIISWGWLYY